MSDYIESDTNPIADQSLQHNTERWSYLLMFFTTSNKGQWQLNEGSKKHIGSKAFDRLDELGSLGWELVSAVPRVTSERKADVMALDSKYATKTAGQWLWFKRRS